MWSVILQAGEFWKFQAKDVATLLIGLAAFGTAATNVWVAYWRRQKLRCEISDVLRLGYGARPKHYLLLRIDVVALNERARPGVIKRLAIRVEEQGRPLDQPLYLRWTEVLKSENIAPKGQGRKIWTDFAVCHTCFGAQIRRAVN